MKNLLTNIILLPIVLLALIGFGFVMLFQRKKVILLTIFSMWGICSFAQKVQTVTIKPTTTILKLKVAAGQKIDIQINEQYPTVKRTLNLKDFSDWRIAFNTAITQGVPLEGESMVIDSDCIPEQHVPFDGDLTVQGTEAKPLVITCNFREGIDRDTYSLYFGSGKKTFKNVIFKKIGSHPFGSCIQTTQTDITYHNSFENCKWEGDWTYDYQSTMGHGSSTFVNCNLFAIITNIHYYSQLGSKDLIMKNCVVKSIKSHNIYSHSWNNYYIDGLTSAGSGKLAFNSYYTNNTGNFKSTYQSFNNCRNTPDAVSTEFKTAPMWRLQSVGSRIKVENSNLPVYEWNRNLDLKNTNTSNKGNGTPMYGNSTADNCTGDLTAMDTLTVTNSNLNYIGGNTGSTLTVTGSSIGYIILKPGNYHFINCKLGDVDIYGNAKVIFENCTISSQYKAIRVFGKADIKFVGESYQVKNY